MEHWVAEGGPGQEGAGGAGGQAGRGGAGSFSWCVQEQLSAVLERKEQLGVELGAVREEVGQKSKHRSAGEELCS